VESKDETIKQLNARLDEVVQERFVIIGGKADILPSAVDRETSFLLARVQELESQREKAHNAHQELFHRHQEQAFKHMKLGLWTPLDENKIKSDLKRMKTRIRTWSREFVVKTNSIAAELGPSNFAVLLKHLLCVVAIRNDNLLPQGMQTGKGPGVLLNALLAQDIHTRIIQQPFLCMGDAAPTLQETYVEFLRLGLNDAHHWRSQTLRLVCPPGHSKSSESENRARTYINNRIEEASMICAQKFMLSPAALLLDPEMLGPAQERAIEIYKQVAQLAFQL
ncbi:hypothetical protein BDZ45DRAFT_761996, partial [Acephala macrosclerotiorum]